MWESGELKASINYLENLTEHLPSIAMKTIQLEQSYEKEYGLPYGHPSVEKIERFIGWMKSNGAIFDKIRMRHYESDYRGVHAIKQFQPSEVVLKIPKNLIITAQKGRETYLGTKIARAHIHLNWDYLVYITVFMLTQLHDSKSFWKPYIDVYPRDVSHFPIFYNNEELALLKGSEMINHIKEEIQEITEEYEAIINSVPEFKEYSLEEYIKNKTLVISRIFYVKMDGVIERALVPLADMFNCHYERVDDTSWCYNEREEGFIVTANKTIEVGNPIYEHYGQKPNYRFLFYYGFLIENNKQNCVYIKLFLNKDDPNIKQKATLIGADINFEIKTFKFFEYYNIAENENDKFLSYLRLIEYEGNLGIFGRYLIPEVPNVMICKFLKRKLKCPILSLENEKKVLKKVKALAKEYLERFPDSYESDMQLLQNKNLTFNTRNCIILRSDEKRIFANLIALADLGLKLMDMRTGTKEYLERQGNLPYGRYFEKSLLPFLSKVKSLQT